MKKIIGVPLNVHDHNTYNGDVHVKYERHTRVKHCLGDQDFYGHYGLMFLETIKNKDRVVSFSFTAGGIKQFGIERYDETLGKEFSEDTKSFAPNNLWDYLQKDNLYYIDHHQSHGAHAFLSSGYKESDILAIDGQGNKNRAVFFDSNFNAISIDSDLQPGIPIGWLWNVMTKVCGFDTLQEGKLMGLAGYGSFSQRWYDVFEFMFEEYLFRGCKYHPDKNVFGVLTKGEWKFDAAFTLQKFTNDKVIENILPHKTSDNICVAGGVAYNGYLNELLTKYWKNVYVPQSPGDEGQGIGCYLHANYTLNGINDAPGIYNGMEYEIDDFVLHGYDHQEYSFYDLCKIISKEISDGKIVGWFQGKSESGNRALGNRSILADPRNPDIKDIINSKVKMREDFRPFAPSVLEEHYQEYFDTNQPSPHMSRIMPVISDKIPGVTHVDGTARIQTVNRETNSLYYDLIKEFYNITGIPMVLNTSFNCQEPIVETPSDAIDTFNRCGLDILVINNYIIRKRNDEFNN